MNTRTITGISVVVVLTAAYLIFFVNWSTAPAEGAFKLEPPRRPLRVAPGRPAPRPPAVYPVTFIFNQSHAVKSIRVVSLLNSDLIATPTPIWHLVASDQPVKMQTFNYGQRIPGMAPAVARARPEPLVADRPYQLIVETADGQLVKIDFQTRAYAVRK
jgi:hypothetical protein